MIHLDDIDKTPVESWGSRELRLARFRAEDLPDDAETGEVCPRCQGDGMLREETGATYTSLECSLCEGSCWVTFETAREYRIRNAVNRRVAHDPT